jgi:AmiR/NasT family two-component response regulator
LLYFAAYDEGLVKAFTTAAEQAILNARRWQPRDRVSNLEAALTSRAEIDQANGVLMAIHGCTAEEAFARLAEQSQHRNSS